MPLFARRQSCLVDSSQALPGRERPVLLGGTHEVLKAPLHPPFPEGSEQAIFALGCFWGAERIFWQLRGVHVTAVGYAGGLTRNPTYEEVCSGRTGHAEAVLVVFDPQTISYEQLLRAFWEGHDPTQGMRQGNDVGTQYRSAIFYHSPEQKAAAEEVIARMAAEKVWERPIVTELKPFSAFYPAEEYHQEYFARNPRQPYCQVVIAPKVAKFRKHYLERLKA